MGGSTDPHIADSARKLAVRDDDVRHAFRHPVRLFEIGEGMAMVIGPTTSGAVLIELGVVDGTGGPVVVHAMKARAKFLGWR